MYDSSTYPVSIIVERGLWWEVKKRAHDQRMRVRDFVALQLKTACAVGQEFQASKEIPYGDWMAILAAWFGRRRDWVDGPEALRLVAEAQTELGWPDDLLTWEVAWSLVQRLLANRQGGSNPPLAPELRESADRAWENFKAGRKEGRV